MPARSTAPQPGRPRTEIVATILDWYDQNARDLPWRRAEASPWGVMVSEFMLQQTPVNRVLGPWHEWLTRWPTPADLAAEPASEAVRAWGRLGYPRRALRLHAAATTIATEHHNQVPTTAEALRRLPGVGEYTAAAIASFAHGRREPVMDTNVRRVLARIDTPDDASPTPTTADRRRALQWLDATDDTTAPHWAAASMELGALLCTARNPDCAHCPVATDCQWLAAGKPTSTEPRRVQQWQGTDRQCRGRLMAELRHASSPLARATLLRAVEAHHDPEQTARALDSLLTDGLAKETDHGITL